MNSHQSAESDYDRARRKAFWRQVGSWLTRRSNDLFPFDEARRGLRAHSQHDRGLHQVPVAKIVGSVGRYRDFDQAFLPRQLQTRERWLSIDRAHYDDVILPPVDLYQIGEVYFVKDGNHRVSVARERRQEFIDAYVTEVQAPVPITSAAELGGWLCRQEALGFLATTRLLQVRSAARINLTLPGQYEKLLKHIDVHRYFLGLERNDEVSYEEAVISWFDRVYSPILEIMRTSNVLAEFPHRTETDLYLWIIERQWYLTEAGVLPEGHTLVEIIRDYAEEFGERPMKRIARSVRRTTQRVVDELTGRSEAENNDDVEAEAGDEVDDEESASRSV